MKKNILFNLAVLSAGAMLLASCSTSKQTAFSKAKYYNFGHHDPVVVFNPATHKNITQDIGEPVPQAEPASCLQPVDKALQTTEAAKNTPVQKIEKQMHSFPRVAGEPVAGNDTKTGCNEKKDESPAYMPEFAGKAAPEATANGGGGGSVNTTVLVILAIFLSPLAVYLYDNAATGRFWLDLVLWVFGVGFLGLFLFTGLLWLVAVIYAIVIVTGH